MESSRYQIPLQIGHSTRLRFRMAPVSKKILNADADWPDDEELCIDNIAAHELLLPFIDQFLGNEFLFHNEINLMPFSSARAMSEEMRAKAEMMKKDLNHPSLRKIYPHITLDLLVAPEEYNQKYLLASSFEKSRAIRENIGIVTDFYQKVADWIDRVTEKYEPADFHELALTAPV